MDRRIDIDECLNMGYIYWEITIGGWALNVEDLDELPTIEVEPVKHGKWEWDKVFGEYNCSVCYKRAFEDGDYGQQLFDHCPNCGARMDGEK